MKENLMPFIVGEDKNVLVIPLLEDKDGQLDIWGDENFWKQAFVNQGNLKKGNLNIVTISKNLGNIANAKANNVFDMSQNQYYELSGFNNLEDIYVVKYSIKDNKIYIKHFPTNTIDEVVFTEETPEELVKLSVTHFKDNKKEIVVEQNESQVANKLEFVYKYPNLGQWTILKNYLQNKPLINDVKVVSMGSGKVHFAFEYVGIIENLEIDLRQKGYNIKKEGGYYVIN